MILAIDPGNTQSGFVLYNPQSEGIPLSGVRDNDTMLFLIEEWAAEPGTICAIEMIASYGMPVGAEVFETCVWIGRFMQKWQQHARYTLPTLVFRKDVKMHLCGQTKGVNDAVIRQRLLDIFGPRGTKKAPGRLYHVKSHAWPALAVAVTAANA